MHSCTDVRQREEVCVESGLCVCVCIDCMNPERYSPFRQSASRDRRDYASAAALHFLHRHTNTHSWKHSTHTYLCLKCTEQRFFPQSNEQFRVCKDTSVNEHLDRLIRVLMFVHGRGVVGLRVTPPSVMWMEVCCGD